MLSTLQLQPPQQKQVELRLSAMPMLLQITAQPEGQHACSGAPQTGQLTLLPTATRTCRLQKTREMPFLSNSCSRSASPRTTV